VSADVCFEANNEPKLNVTPSPRSARRESCGAAKRILPVSVGEHLVDGHLGNPACRIPSARLHALAAGPVWVRKLLDLGSNTCSSSGNLRLIRRFEKRGSGSSGVGF
jgi:hypothetical protein